MGHDGNQIANQVSGIVLPPRKLYIAISKEPYMKYSHGDTIFNKCP